MAVTVVQRETPERAPNKSLFHAHLYDPGRFENYHTVPFFHDKLVRRQIVLAFSLRHDIFNFCLGNVNAVIVVNEISMRLAMSRKISRDINLRL